MGEFHYEAENARGERIQGHLEAASLADAQSRLRADGLTPLDVQPVAGDVAAPRLRGREAEQVVAQVADLGAVQAPLAAGLRAAARESTQPRVARALRSLASSLERGTALEVALTQQAKTLPPHVQGLVAAAVRTGHLGPALDELVEHQRILRDTARGLLAAIAYPLIVLSLTGVLLTALPVFVVPQFREIFEEFELELPKMTEFLIWTSDWSVWLTRGPGAWGVLVIVAIAGAVFLAAPLVIGRARSRRFLVTAPLVGPLWNWSAAASFSRLLAVLLDSGVSLSEALRLTADGLYDANLRELSYQLSEGVQQGRKFSELLASTPRIPASMVPLVRWGEATGELPEALRKASEMFLQRVRLRSILLQSISPPLVFILVFLAIGFMVIALFLPLFVLIQGLT